MENNDFDFELYYEEDDMEYPDIGWECTIRSSEERQNMIGWSTMEYDGDSHRWMETEKFGYACYADDKAFSEATDMEIEELHEKYPDMNVRESFCEGMLNHDKTEDVRLILTEYVNGDGLSSIFLYKNFTHHQTKELEREVNKWHRTGVFGG